MILSVGRCQGHRGGQCRKPQDAGTSNLVLNLALLLPAVSSSMTWQWSCHLQGSVVRMGWPKGAKGQGPEVSPEHPHRNREAGYPGERDCD